MSRDVFIIETGTANLASVRAGVVRAGGTPRIAASPETVAEARHVVLPGVGSFQAALHRLGDDGLTDAVATRVSQGRPTLAVCLGMQLLCEASAESREPTGLGLLPGTVTRFSDGVRVPHLGWNLVRPPADSLYLREGFAYFAHSYRLCDPPAGWLPSLTDYGGRFVSALERGGVLACQFHPELSADWGTAVLQRWLDTSEDAWSASC